VVFLTKKSFSPTNPDHIKDLNIISIDSINDIEEYSTFMLKRLHKHIETDHCLIVQWDGFIINRSTWDNVFLKYDYIGAPWITKNGLITGNGGFSLRSKKLLRALTSNQVIPHHPEDECICVTYREILEKEWGINFAPPKVANKFAFEFTSHSSQFGFHGLSNFPEVIGSEDLKSFITSMPEALFINEYFIVFAKKIQALQDKSLKSLLKQKILIFLEKVSGTNLKKPQVDFLVESLFNLQMYRQAINILSNRRHQAQWKGKYLKILLIDQLKIR